MLRLLFAALGSATRALAASASSFSLSDLSWTLKNQNGSIVVPGEVPSQSHLDLTRAGIITEPLLGINDYTERWVWNDNWTYTADISSFVSSLNGSSHTTLLQFHGLDTIANITLCGKTVAWTNNQFRQYTFDVTKILPQFASSSDKNLTITFQSAISYGQEESTKPFVEQLPDSTAEIPANRPWIRKIQSDFGWDWGPAFSPSGIHKPAYFITLPSSDPTKPSLWAEETSIEIYKKGQKPSIEPNAGADWIVEVTLGSVPQAP